MEEWDLAIEEAVRKLKAPFDTHQLIKKIAHSNQRKYINALAEIDSGTPFHKFHSDLGRRINIVCKRLGFTAHDSRSPDMFGQNSKCKTYSKTL